MTIPKPRYYRHGRPDMTDPHRVRVIPTVMDRETATRVCDAPDLTTAELIRDALNRPVIPADVLDAAEAAAKHLRAWGLLDPDREGDGDGLAVVKLSPETDLVLYRDDQPYELLSAIGYTEDRDLITDLLAYVRATRTLLDIHRRATLTTPTEGTPQ